MQLKYRIYLGIFFSLLLSIIFVTLYYKKETLNLETNLPLIYETQKIEDTFYYSLTLGADAELQNSKIIGIFNQSENEQLQLTITTSEISAKVFLKKNNSYQISKKITLQNNETFSIVGNSNTITVLSKNNILLTIPLTSTPNNQHHSWFASNNTLSKEKIIFKTQKSKNLYTFNPQNYICTKTNIETSKSLSKILLLDSGSVQIGAPSWFNYTYSCNIFPKKIQNLEFYFCQQNRQARYKIRLQENSLELIKTQGNNDIILGKSNNFILPILQWNNFSVEQLNGLISIYLNQRLLIQAYDPSPWINGTLGWQNKGNKTIDFYLADVKVNETTNISLKKQIIPILQALSNPTLPILSPNIPFVKTGTYTLSVSTEDIHNQTMSFIICQRDKFNYLKIDFSCSEDLIHAKITSCIKGQERHYNLPQEKCLNSKLNLQIILDEKQAEIFINTKMIGLLTGLETLLPGSYGLAIPASFKSDLKYFSYTPEIEKESSIILKPLLEKISIQDLGNVIGSTKNIKKLSENYLIENKYPLIEDWILSLKKFRTDNQPWGLRCAAWNGIKENDSPLYLYCDKQTVFLEYGKRQQKIQLDISPNQLVLEHQNDRFIIKTDKQILFNIPILDSKAKVFKIHFYEKDTLPTQHVNIQYMDGKEYNSQTILTDWLCIGKQSQLHRLSTLEPDEVNRPCSIWYTKKLPDTYILSFEIKNPINKKDFFVALNTSLVSYMPEKHAVLICKQTQLPILFNDNKKVNMIFSNLTNDTYKKITIIKLPDSLEIYLDDTLYAIGNKLTSMSYEGLIFWSYQKLDISNILLIGSKIKNSLTIPILPRLDLPKINTP